MIVLFDPSVPITQQHLLTGTGVFDGTSVGRSYWTTGTGNAALTFWFEHYGADPNTNYTFNLNDPGVLTDETTATYHADTRILEVVLAHDGLNPIATAAEVATLVNALRMPKPFLTGRLPFRVTYGGTGASAVVPDSGQLAHGLNPDVSRNRIFRFAPTANDHGGLFYFEANEPLLLKQFEATLNSSVAWTLSLIPITEDFQQRTTSTTIVASGTASVISLLNFNLIVQPLTMISFTANSRGVCRVNVQKEAAFPRVSP